MFTSKTLWYFVFIFNPTRNNKPYLSNLCVPSNLKYLLGYQWCKYCRQFGCDTFTSGSIQWSFWGLSSYHTEFNRQKSSWPARQYTTSWKCQNWQSKDLPADIGKYFWQKPLQLLRCNNSSYSCREWPLWNLQTYYRKCRRETSSWQKWCHTIWGC